MSKIDIKNLFFSTNEVGGFVKSSKVIFSWEFILENSHHKIELSHSRLKGKRVVLIDDSIVRGTTSKRIVNLLREAGASEVHVRISSPQITNPCFYGVDISTYEELISARMDLDGVREYIGADSLYFLSKEALFEAAKRNDLCLACFTGKYPTALYTAVKDANKDGKF